MNQGVSSTQADLNAYAAISQRLHRASIVRTDGLQVLHLTLAAGQTVPSHRHPGQHVLLQGLKGSVVIDFGDETRELHPGHLLHFTGERPVSLRHGGGEPCAVLVTLAHKPLAQKTPAQKVEEP